EGKVELLADAQGGVLLPSVVHYSANGAVQVGDLPGTAGTRISSGKRLMGRGRADIDYRPGYGPQAAAGGGMTLVQTVAGDKSPVEVSAEILRVLAERGSKAAGAAIAGAVITVPAYFDEAQRQATRDAARLAGLKVLRLLSEPTAAAV